MRVMCILTASSQRSFEVEKNGAKETIKVMEMDLTDGLDTFHATAYDKVAQRAIDAPIKPGSLLNVDLDFSVKTIKTEKGEFPRQDVRVSNYSLLYGAE